MPPRRMQFFLRLVRALVRFVTNVVALWFGGNRGGRAEATGAQLYALAETVRCGLEPAPLRSRPRTSRDERRGASRPGGIVEVRLDRGRPWVGQPSPEDARFSLGLRRRTYVEFLSLVGYLEPRDARCLLHLADDPGAPAGETLRSLTFNRRVDAPERSIIVPDPHFVRTRAYAHQRRTLARSLLPWEARVERAMFRGSSTGGSLRAGQQASDNPRVRLCLRSLERPHALDARITRVVNADPERPGELAAMGVMGEFLAPAGQAAFKYLMAIDGWVGEWDGLYWKLWSGSVVLWVESAWEQWYTARLEPFVHYVPVKADLSDLFARIAWCREHDSECRAIAARARALLDEHVTFADAVRYTAAQLRTLA